jgi:hypothetical protein
MKKNSTSGPTVLSVLFKSLTAALGSIFQSSNNREFKRLKDFIAS